MANALRSMDAGSLDAGARESDGGPRSHGSFGLTGSEQRVAAVLLLAHHPDVEDGAPRAAELGALVNRFGCYLDVIGDGTQVITVARPPTATDQATRVARCALAARALFPGVPMALTTGWSLTSGDPLPGAPMGEAIDRAAALLAQQGGDASRSAIAVDEVTAALLDPQFEVEGSQLTGFRDNLIAARTLLGKATPCLGREWELSTVEAQLLACTEELRAVALVFTAPPGMGKSRLAIEAVTSLRRTQPDLAVWMARGSFTHEGTSLGLLGQALRAACGIQAGEPLDEQRRKLGERVARSALSRDRERLTVFLGELLGVSSPDEASPALRAARKDAQLGFEQMRRAFIDFLACECVAHPVLIVLDDLHWADAASIRFLDAALSTLEQAPLMVVAFAAPQLDEQFPRLWAGRNVQRLRLQPLARRPAERLARLALGSDVDSGVIGRLLDLAEGNVFFLEELIRAASARRDASPADTPDLGADGAGALPQTVLGVVQARLDAIPPGPRRMLRAASIFGESFWPDAVTALLDRVSTPAEGWVDALVAGELVVRRISSRFAGEPELVFRNALLREGAYAMLTDRDRAAGHLLAGAWLEQRGEPDPAVLARHFELGGDAARAALQHVRVAEQAMRASELSVVLARAARAISLGLPEPTHTHALGLRCEAQTWRGDWPAAAATADEVLAVAPRGGAAWARAAVAKQGHARVSGDVPGLMSMLTSVWSAEPAPDAVSTVLYALHSGMVFLCMGGQFVTATRLRERVDELVPRIQEMDPTTEGRVHMCHQIVEALGSGHPARALHRAQAARDCYALAGDHGHLAWVQLFLGIALWELGAFAEARRELAVIEATGPSAGVTLTMRDAYEALNVIDAGALDEAAAIADRAARSAASLPPAVAASKQGDALWIRAEVALRAGDARAAERDARDALARLHTYPLAHTAVQVLLAAALLAQGRGAEALAEVRAPLQALEVQGGRGFRAARTQIVAVEALAATGEHAEARRILALARESLLRRAAGIRRRRAAPELPGARPGERADPRHDAGSRADRIRSGARVTAGAPSSRPAPRRRPLRAGAGRGARPRDPRASGSGRA